MRRLQFLLGLALATSVAGAQAPISARIWSDNDGFNFWIPSWQRTDHEYTSGAFGTLEYAGPSAWVPFAKFRGRACGATDARCATHTFTLAQELYTHEPPPSPGVDPPPHPAYRPNAGWLYVELGEKSFLGLTTDEFRIDVGVVGPPALGEPMQRFFHEIGPAYPKPVDWSTQLPFEPGFAAHFTRSRVLGAFGDSSGVTGSFSANAGASLGTILTGARAGASGDVAIPIGPAAHDGWWPRAVVSVDFALHGVFRDEFLDGTFFRTSEHVAKNPVYDEERLSLELRWSRISLAYKGTRAGTQYRLQQGPASWGTLYAEWRPGR